MTEQKQPKKEEIRLSLLDKDIHLMNRTIVMFNSNNDSIKDSLPLQRLLDIYIADKNKLEKSHISS